MAKEIERKFLIKTSEWPGCSRKTYFKQGYLSTDPERVVRVRIAGEKAFITIKGANSGIVRNEYEYEIPVDDAHQMLDSLCHKPLIEKIRYFYPQENLVWEIDEFLGDNKGLFIAEIELPSEDYAFFKPQWIGEEITGDKRYYNSNLVKNPYNKW